MSTFDIEIAKTIERAGYLPPEVNESSTDADYKILMALRGMLAEIEALRSQVAPQ